MHKNIIYILFFNLLFGLLETNGQTYLYQGFESGGLPSGWSEEFVKGSTSWRYENGGYDVDPGDDLSRRPTEAYAGNKNALFQVQNLVDTTILVTKPLDSLEFAIRPVLTFYHAQEQWYHETYNNDKLNVFYRQHIDSSWFLLAKYPNTVSSWTFRELLIPDTILSTTGQIGFEAITNWGYGVCIDEVEIIETGIVPREVEKFNAFEAGNDKIPSKSELNPVLRLDLKVTGNTGKLILDSLKIHSANTNDDNILEYGISLYKTTDTIFEDFTFIDSAQAFVDGIAKFNNLGVELATGYSSLWITVDVDSAAGHGNIIDLYLDENSSFFHYDTTGVLEYSNIIGVEDGELEYEFDGETFFTPLKYSLPGSMQNPPGERVIYQTIFIDGFETDLGWYLTGEWERDEPQGFTDYSDLSYGDPSSAYRGQKVLGTDLTGLLDEPGDYDNLTDTNWVAISPEFDFTYFNDLSIFYYRWLNTDNNDNARFDVSTDSMATWQTIWANNSLFFENEWRSVDHDISSIANRSKNVFFKFNIGPSDESWNLSGWNIDNFVITGNYITDDVGVIEIISPSDGCGLTTEETVSFIIKNFGAEPTNDTVPVSYSLNGGIDFVSDTLFESIPIGETRTITFDIPADLSLPAAYSFVFRTDLPGDEDPTNDEMTRTIVSQPIFTPPYTEHFESEQGYWKRTSLESSWAWGTPGISSPAGGKAWTTIIGGYYPNNDSSFIESPCFDFSGITDPIFDFYFKVETQENKDGFLLEYSIDGGSTWDVADTNTRGYNWPWYNDTVEVLEHRGWTGNENWKYQKQFLPAVMAGESNVKLRLFFASDADTVRAGISVDGMRIYDAPYDIGVVSIDSVENACQFINSEQISVTVKNFGVRDMQVGDTVIIGLDASRNGTLKDTLVLSSILHSNDSVTLKLSKTINLDTAGRYDLTAYTLIEDDPFFYSETCNDSASFFFSIHPNPTTNLADTIKSARPDTLTVQAYYDPLYQYAWDPAGGGDDSVYHVLTAGDIYLTITNSDSTSCVTLDTINIHKLIPDLSIDSLMSPISSCELDTSETVTVRIKNLGTDTLSIGDTLILGYEVDAGVPVIDTFLLDAKFYPDSTMDFHIAKDSLDLSAFSTYDFKVYLDFAWDSVPDNDTLETLITTWGYPSVDVGPDVTIYTLEHVIDAGPGYSSYSWNTGGSARYDTVYAKGDYHVTITDEHGCPNSDTVYVNFDYLDIGVSAVLEPYDQCIPSDSIEIIARITNTGTDTIFDNTSLEFGYRINGGTVFTDNYVLNQDILPDSGFVYTFTDKQLIETPGDYYLEVFTLIPGDINTANDTLADTISLYPYPELELGADTLVKAYAYTLDAGYDSTYNYLWSTSADTSAISISSSGNYAVTVTSQFGCVSTDAKKVTMVVPDVTISGLVYPGTSCIPKYPVKMKATIYNNGTDTVYAGETLTMGYLVDGANLTTEPYTLSANFYPNATRIYEFTNSFVFTEPKETEITVFALLDDDINANNDTLAGTITFYGYPEVELGNDTLIKSYEYTLDAGYDPNYLYSWNTGESTSSITVTTDGSYSVSVTSVEGCITLDTIDLIMKVPDIEVTELTYPETSCIPQSPVNVRLNIHNNGNDTLFSGESIIVGYNINGGVPVEENYTLTENLLPTGNYIYQFTQTEDFTSSGSRNITAYAIMQDDINTGNDTIEEAITFYDYPVVELGSDTLVKSYEYELDAGFNANYSYKWSTDEETSSITVTSGGSYSVTVTSGDGCVTTDNVNVSIKIQDLMVSELLYPVTSCVPEPPIHVEVNIHNNGNDTLFAGESIKVGYVINGGIPVEENYTLTETFLPGANLVYQFSTEENLITSGLQDIGSYVVMIADINNGNDTLNNMISFNEYPVLELGNDTLIKTENYRLVAGNDLTYIYDWSNGLSNNEIVVTSNGTYGVTVTTPEGCSSEDEITLLFTYPNIGVIAMTEPTDLCGLVEKVVAMEFKNLGSDTLGIGDKFNVGYKVNDAAAVIESITLGKEMLPGDTMQYNFTGMVEMSTAGAYNFKIFTALERDLLQTDDTLTETINILDIPEVDFNKEAVNDTFATDLPTTLDAGAGYTQYSWSDGQKLRLKIISQPGWYEVTVTNANGCQGSGKIYIAENTVECDTCCGEECCVDTCTNVDQIISDQLTLDIYPNPAQDALYIDFYAKSPGRIVMQLFNAQGKAVIMKQTDIIQQYNETVNIQSLPNGVYILRVIYNDKSRSYKIIKQ